MDANILMPKDIEDDLMFILEKCWGYDNIYKINRHLKCIKVKSTYEAPVLFMFASQCVITDVFSKTKFTQERKESLISWLVKLSLNIHYEADDRNIYMVFGDETIFETDGKLKQER